jgi:hypothetical protein
MKYRIAKSKRVKPVLKEPTHEERQIADIFAEEEGVETNINLDDPKPTMDEAYEYIDYGLVKEESEKLWESFATDKASQFNNYIIKVMASFDALQSVEDHVNKNFDVGIRVTTKSFVDDINAMLLAKFKNIFLTDLEFTEEQAAELFTRYISKVSKHQPNILSLVNDVKTEESPYGALGLTRGLHDD